MSSFFGGMIPQEQGRLVLNVDEDLNDQAKEIPVPANARWKVLWAYMEYTETASTTPEMQLHLRDAADDLIFKSESISHSGSGEERFMWLPNVGDTRESRARYHYLPLPRETFLPAGYDIAMLSIGGDAGDDMILQVMVMEWIEE